MTKRLHRQHAFTLVELIGVLAVLSVLATVMAPASIKLLDRAAVRSEEANLRSIGQGMSEYVRSTRTLPTATNWSTVLTTSATFFVAQSKAQLDNNARNVTRRFVVDPTGSTRRALLISGMRPGLTLPSAATLSSQFDTLWNLAEDAVPNGSSWSAWANFGEYLVIERLNFARELTTLSFSIVNASATTPAYRVIRASGSTLSRTTVAASSSVVVPLYPGDRIELYAPSAVTPAYVYSVGDLARTLQFNGTTWSPQ